MAACQVAAELGCASAVLNATDQGERLYRRCGFASLGLAVVAGRVDDSFGATALGWAEHFGPDALVAMLRPVSPGSSS